MIAVQVGGIARVLAAKAVGEGKTLADSVTDTRMQGCGGFGRKGSVLLRRPAVTLLGVEWMVCLL